jgi:large subunit ribosomal protein L13
MKTLTINPAKIERRWKLIDAEGKVLGRVASEIANILRGKNKPIYSPSTDVGDFVVVINADKVVLTGNKANTKEYFSHSTYAGGDKFVKYAEAMKKDPTQPLIKAVRGMIPHTSLGRKIIKKLKVYGGPEHPHAAQKLEPVAL